MQTSSCNISTIEGVIRLHFLFYTTKVLEFAQKGLSTIRHVYMHMGTDTKKDDCDALKPLLEKHNISWHEFIHQLATYPDIVEQALELPPEIDDTMHVCAITLHRFIPMWMSNIHENFAAIKNGLDVRDIPKTDLPALIIGGGPSLYRNNHLQLLADQGFDVVILATDRVLKDCLYVGVVPDYVCVLDGQEGILPFIDHQIVDDYAEQIGAIMCVTTHPTVVKRWAGKIHWFTNSISDNVAPNVGYLLNHLLKKTEVTTAGHVSSLGWCIAHTIGCRTIALIGVDLSYPADTPVEETENYDKYLKAFDGDAEKTKECYTPYHHKFFDTDCYYNPIFSTYINCSMGQFATAVEADAGCKIINCTEGGAIESNNVICMRFVDFLAGRRV